jgi:hypothetical protein
MWQVKAITARNQPQITRVWNHPSGTGGLIQQTINCHVAEEAAHIQLVAGEGAAVFNE